MIKKMVNPFSTSNKIRFRVKNSQFGNGILFYQCNKVFCFSSMAGQTNF